MADLNAGRAAGAFFPVDKWSGILMYCIFCCNFNSAHPQILYCPAIRAAHMAFPVAQYNHCFSICNVPAHTNAPEDCAFFIKRLIAYLNFAAYCLLCEAVAPCSVKIIIYSMAPSVI